MGGREYRDWGVVTQLLAAIANSTNSQTLVLANAPKSVRNKFEYIEGPFKEKKSPDKPTTIEDIAAMFSGGGTL